MKVDCEYGIIGGGVAGLAMAIGLASLGKNFLLFERSSEIRGIGAGFGLAANAMQAFDHLGLKEEVEKIGFYTETYRILDERGNVLLSPDAQRLSQQYDQKNFTVHRADLHSYLLSKLKADQVVSGKKLAGLQQHTDCVELRFDDGTSYCCRYLIAADGVKSFIRQHLFPKSKPRYAGYTCWRATIENVVELQHGSETWGSKGRFGMTPLVGDRIYWYACINSSPDNPIYRDFTTADLAKQFSAYHRPIPQILENTEDGQLIWNDIVDIRPLSNFAKGNMVLIGDAAHATTPNLGQGACQALEDVAVLMDELQIDQTVSQAFSNFERRRIKRTKYITDTSRQIGWVAQWTNPAMIGMRNSLLKIMPAKWNQASLEKLLATDFMKLRN